MSRFTDNSEYVELVKTTTSIHKALSALATLHNHEVIILRMYNEKGFVRFCFSVDGKKYLITANLTMQMGEKNEWKLQSNMWPNITKEIDEFSLANGHFLK